MCGQNFWENLQLFQSVYAVMVDTIQCMMNDDY